MAELSEFDLGVVVGLLIGEGSFGGDGKQPQVTLRMHIRHEALFRWLTSRFPGSRLYGPWSGAGQGCAAPPGGATDRRAGWSCRGTAGANAGALCRLHPPRARGGCGGL